MRGSLQSTAGRRVCDCHLFIRHLPDVALDGPGLDLQDFVAGLEAAHFQTSFSRPDADARCLGAIVPSHSPPWQTIVHYGGDSNTTSLVVSPDVERALVPSLILQPLVENALHHGVSDLEIDARVEIVASRRGDMLRLEVREGISSVIARRLHAGPVREGGSGLFVRGFCRIATKTGAR